MKVAIVGSRGESWSNPQYVRSLVRTRMMELIDSYGGKRITFISGHASSGVDFWAEEYAKAAGFDFIPYPADWKTYGKSAGFKRMPTSCRQPIW